MVGPATNAGVALAFCGQILLIGIHHLSCFGEGAPRRREGWLLLCPWMGRTSCPLLPAGKSSDQWVVQRIGKVVLGLPRLRQRRRQQLLRQSGRLLVSPRLLQ